MAHSLSARKRARQNIKRKLQNQTVKSEIKTEVKRLRLMLTGAAKETGKDKLTGKISEMYQLIDKAVSKGVIHTNKASRLKSRLTIAANKVGQK